jgi:catechol 2,3-dioxygenase-like lactoylglutathione lyase family enzyme
MRMLDKARVHHVGIQTADLDNCVNWYIAFFGGEKKWALDRFSELTTSRLPGIGRLVEVAVGDIRFHLFDRAGHNRAIPDPVGFQFQHVCIQVDTAEELRHVRDRWTLLYESGRFSFAHDEAPTDIVVDSDGVESLYLYDVNGLEFEFSFLPGDRG